MSNNKLTVLGIIAIIMVVLATVQSRVDKTSAPAAGVESYLIQGLAPDSIASIVLGTGDDAVTLKKSGSGFVVADKDNYPAKTSEINDLITKCLDIRTTELYTDDPANHKDLGITEADARYVVRFMKDDSSVMTGVIVGKAKQQGQGTYVRLVGSDNVYVTLESPWLRTGAMDYIDSQLVSINKDDIESVTVGSAGKSYTIKSEDGKITLPDIPEDKQAKGTDYESVFAALDNLSANDIKRFSTWQENVVFDHTYTCTLKDTTVYILNLVEKDGKTYITIDSKYTDTTPITQKEVVEAAEEELKEKEQRLLAAENAQKFSLRHNGWVYEIPSYKADNLTKNLDDLLEDKPEPEQETPDPNNTVE